MSFSQDFWFSQDQGKKPMETICSINEVLSQVIFKSSFFCFSILPAFHTSDTPGFDRQQLERVWL